MRPRVRSLSLGLLGAGMLLGLGLLLRPEGPVGFPSWFWPHDAPFWWPFRAQAHVFSWAALLAALGGFALLGAAVLLPRWSAPRLALLLAGGSLLVNLAVVALPSGGLEPFAVRLLNCGHAEFFVRASLHPDLLESLTHYETLVTDGDPAFYSRQKGPANLAYHVAVHHVANAAPVRRSLDRSVGENAGFYRRVVDGLERGMARNFEAFDESRGLRVARAFLLMPLVSSLLSALLPLPVLLLGLTLLPREGAVAAAATSAVVPPILFEQVQLDGSVFPLLFAAGLAVFVTALHRRSSGLAALAGVLAALYAWFTLAAAVLAVICIATLLLYAFAPSQDDHAPSLRWSAAALGSWVLGLVGTLVFLRGALAFHVIDRYLDARGLQAMIRDVNVRAEEPAWRWIVLNTVEFGASLGPLLCVLALIGALLSVMAVVRGRGKLVDATSVAVFLTIGALLTVGQNSEVYRLWAFLGIALLVPAIRAANDLFPLDRPAGRLAYWALVLLWTLPVATRFGHVG